MNLKSLKISIDNINWVGTSFYYTCPFNKVVEIEVINSYMNGSTTGDLIIYRGYENQDVGTIGNFINKFKMYPGDSLAVFISTTGLISLGISLLIYEEDLSAEVNINTVAAFSTIKNDDLLVADLGSPYEYNIVNSNGLDPFNNSADLIEMNSSRTYGFDPTSDDDFYILSDEDFTIEFYVKPISNSTANSYYYFSTRNSYSGSTPYLYLRSTNSSSTGYLTFTGSGINISSTSGNNFNEDEWNHFAITREGDIARMFVNGIFVNSDTSASNSQGANGIVFQLGGRYGSENNVPALYSYIRFIKGEALYTDTFTLPTVAPF